MARLQLFGAVLSGISDSLLFSLRTLSRSLLLFFSVTGPLHAADHCVILQYHHISSETPASTSVTPALFKAHLDYLNETDFTLLSLESVVTHILGKKPLPQRCAAITFDDAYRSIYEAAYPLLRRYDYPATVFVSTRGIDKKFGALMTWDQMREMSDHQIDFANHSASHSHLIRRQADESSKKWRERVVSDLREAESRLLEEVGRPTRLFAYPYGEFTPELLEIISQLGLIGFGQQSGPAWFGSNPLVISRFNMSTRYADLAQFRMKVNTHPLPVVEKSSKSPLVSEDNNPPGLTVKLTPGRFDPQQIACFASGEGKIPISIRTETSSGLISLTLKPSRPLRPGRSRYNCTAPHQQKKAYFWFSHLWIKPKADGSWYSESL